MDTSLSTGTKTSPWEWVVRIALPALTIFAGIYVWNWIAPLIILALKNLITTIILGLVTTALLVPVLYAIMNPTVVWMAYTAMCNKFTNWMVGIDPISFMEASVQLLIKKIQGLKADKLSLKGDTVELGRKIEAKMLSYEKNMRDAASAMKLGHQDVATDLSNMALQDKNSIELFKPIYAQMEGKLAYLDKVQNNWERTVKNLSYTIDVKKTEFEMLKKTAKALGRADDFARGNTEANQLYDQSVRALENKVSGYTAFIQEFEQATKGKMKLMDIEAAGENADSLQLLEEYMNNGKLIFNNDFSQYQLDVKNFGADIFAKKKVKTIDITPTTPPAQSGKAGGEFDNLLH